MKRIRGCINWGLGTFLGLIVLPGILFIFNSVEKRDLDEGAMNNAGGSIIELEQGRVHYFLEGPEDAPLVVLIHGFSVPSYVWEPTTTHLNKNGYQTLRYDLYGRGYSDRPYLDYDISLFEGQLTRLVDGLNLDEPFTVIGLSMGGPIAARYTYQHLDRVNGLVLISPEVSQTSNSDIFPMNIPLVGDYLMPAVMEPYILPKLQANDFVYPERFPDWEAKYREQLQFKGTGRALLSTIRELVELDPRQEYKVLQESDLPVLLIWGSADQTIGRDQVDLLQQILPEMDVKIVEDAGHLVHYERSDEVNFELIDFLDRIAR